jgi:hypothetical protein
MRTLVSLGSGLVVVGLMSALAAAGCGNGDDDDSTDGGATGTKDGSTTGTGTDGGTGTGSDSGGGGGTETAGTLLFGAGGTDNNMVPTGYQIVGVFVTGSSSGTGGGSPCGAVVDSCQYCGGGTLDAGTVHVAITEESAGTLTIDDGTAAIATLTYDSTEQIYQSDSTQDGQSTAVWAPGDTLDVTASGAAFPAFTGSVKAPLSFTGVTPAFADESMLTVPTSGLTVSWTPAGDSSQVKLLLGVDANLNSTSVSCTVADSAGKIVVPASLLAQLAANGDSSGTVGLTRTLTSTATASGGATVALTAQALEYTGQFTFSQ